MPKAWFRFHGELNDFLPAERRQKRFAHSFERRTSIKDMIESLGVPHTEVDVILADGESVDFNKIVVDGERFNIYPVGSVIATAIETTDPLLHLQPTPLPEPSFVVDANLGRLARYLRLLGFDTLYRNDYDDRTVADISANEQRILLTRDRVLLRRKIIDRAYFVRTDDPRQQLREVVQRYDLCAHIRPFSRCIRCNGRLKPVAKQAIDVRLEPKTRRYYNEFLICERCGQIYWRGSHYQRAMAIVEDVCDNMPGD